jgi:ribonuclease P protein component
MERLRRRTDFQAAAKGARAPAKAFVLQARARESETDDQPGKEPKKSAVRLGFTVSRQVGNAVERNRVRRRLREVVRSAPPTIFQAGHDYVVIGRSAALKIPFAELVRDFGTAVKRIHAAGGSRTRPLHAERGRNRDSDATC